LSTAYIREEAEAALQGLQNLADAADRRVAEIDSRHSELHAQQDHVMKGARLATQFITDERVDLTEERNQLAGTVPPSSDDRDDEPPAPAEPPVVERPAAPAPEPTVEREVVVEEPPAHQPTCAHDTVVREPVVVQQRPAHVMNVRNWAWLQWLLAALGAFGFLMLSVHTTGAFDPVKTDWFRDTLVVLYIVFMTVFGFFLGGLIGSLIDEAVEQDRNAPAD
jgi:hypothetical protein